MGSPKAFSGLLKTGPFDWPAFWRTLPWQPVPQWLVLSALAYPFSRAFPALSRAACDADGRAMLVKLSLVAYTMFVPPVAAAAVYLAAGRRRIAHRHHRMMGDLCVALLVVMSAADVWLIASQIRERWETLGPALGSLRAACWPPAP